MNVFPHLFFFFSFMFMGVFFGLSWFALSAPGPFSDWFTPYRWFTRHQSSSRRKHQDKIFSIVVGAFFLICLMGVCFLLGGFFVTAAFNLWGSPFAFIFQGVAP